MNLTNKTTYPGHHKRLSGVRSNWLRAAVLGANDGIVSVASIVVGVAGASNSRSFIVTAGIAGLVAGALSMAVGEFISVSSQRDIEKALLDRELYLLETFPKEEREELAMLYRQKGLSEKTARLVASELTAKDTASAHFDAELGIDPNQLTNPWHAALASAIAFIAGAIIPLAAIALPPWGGRLTVTFIAVIIALAVTGLLSAKASGAKKLRATTRVIVGGTAAMVVTYLIGLIFGSNIK